MEGASAEGFESETKHASLAINVALCPRMACTAAYGCCVDRVDRWLNTQRGWRRVFVAWVTIAPIGLGSGALWATWREEAVGTGVVGLRVAVGVLAALPVAVLLLRLGLWRVRKSRPWYPPFSWRTMAYLYSFMAGMTTSVYGSDQILAGRHHDSFKPFALLMGAALVFLVWDALYSRKLRRRAEADARAAAS